MHSQQSLEPLAMVLNDKIKQLAMEAIKRSSGDHSSPAPPNWAGGATVKPGILVTLSAMLAFGLPLALS